MKETFNLNKTQTDKAKNEVTSAIKDVVQKNIETYHNQVQEIEHDFTEQIQTAQEAHDGVKVEQLKTEFEQKKVEVNQTFTENLNAEVSVTVETAVENKLSKWKRRRKRLLKTMLGLTCVDLLELFLHSLWLMVTTIQL